MPGRRAARRRRASADGSSERAACSRRRARRAAPTTYAISGGEPGEREHAAPAPEHAREDVAAEEVGAERRVARSDPRTESRSARRARPARRTARTARCRARATSSTKPTDRRVAERRNRMRRASLVTARPQLRDEQHDEQVGDDVDDDVDRGEQDRDRLHLAHVADRDRVDELLADARVGEEVLDDDDPADQVLDVLREDLDARARARCAGRSARPPAARGSRSAAPSGRSPPRASRSSRRAPCGSTPRSVTPSSVRTGRTSVVGSRQRARRPAGSARPAAARRAR